METDYKDFVQKILKEIPERTRKILSRRFGLEKKEKGETLEVIGKSYNITRERVRQIERDGFKRIKKIINSSDLKKDFEKIKTIFEKKIKQFGGVKKEEELISEINFFQSKNQAFFLLNLIDTLKREKADNDFYAFWYNDPKKAVLAKKIANEFVEEFKKRKEPDSIENVFKNFGKKENLNKEEFFSYLEISRRISRSIDGKKIGLVDFSEINPKTVKDKIVLVLNENKKPLHFREITDLIFSLNKDLEKRDSRSFSLHPQTVHNELIRGGDFVLVGRGLYALKDWGYNPGRVKDVIKGILNSFDEPLTKEQITEEVLKQRMVKKSTIFLGLQDKKIFDKNEEGKYKIREA
ncbi:MAG: sigma factor-like helix-turn-helix DNA-binding protein [Candidatus Pacebacteria bacterium]|nr:sigma factor-like helix-turn-helix DNA-binding protein [Candidatus Paceibacterota bacterium]